MVRYHSDTDPESPPLASERHERGRQALAALLNHWLGTGKLSHDQLIAIASWGLGEQGLIDAAVISRVRNGKQVRGASWKHLDALAAANRAIWLWQTKAQRGAWAELGPQGGWGVREEWLQDAIWLPHPIHSDSPLSFAAMAEVLAGYMDLPYLATVVMSPAEAKRMSNAMVSLLERTIAERSWGPREGVRKLLEAYPVQDVARQRRLREVIVGDHQLTRDEMEVEMHALAETLESIRGLEPGSYGTAELRKELQAADAQLRTDQ
jgi:hypothetical protein